jgi:hypothetical protein
MHAKPIPWEKPWDKWSMQMADKDYNNEQKAEFTDNINSLAINPDQKKYLISRWLDQVFWMEGRAKTCQERYYFGRVVAIAGGVMVPALGAFSGSSGWAQAGVVVIGIFVAFAMALEEFFKFGERWRHYRRIIEALKKEWWMYFELCAGYAEIDHATGFNEFAGKVEDILAADVDLFLTKVTADTKPKTVAEGKGGK